MALHKEVRGFVLFNFFQKGKHVVQAFFTTGQVAKICWVSPRTVTKWFDSGRLSGYRIPGSLDRRIPRDQLIRFLKEYGMPLERVTQNSILLITKQEALVQALQQEFEGEIDIQCVGDAFEAGRAASASAPLAMIIDLSLGTRKMLRMAHAAQRDFPETVCVGLVSDENYIEASGSRVFAETFRAPFDPTLLAARLRSKLDL